MLRNMVSARMVQGEWELMDGFDLRGGADAVWGYSVSEEGWR